MRPRIAATLTDNAELLQTFKLIATLQPVEAASPPDRRTDYAGGSRAAAAMGMRRLSERLATLATG